MEFKDLIDVKKLMCKLAKDTGEEGKYYQDFLWFSEINYTTSSEYRGELKEFIEKLKEDDDILNLKKELIDLYNWL